MARSDPFAGAKLSQDVGLDQRLFQPPPAESQAPPKGRTSVRKDERTLVRSNLRKLERPEGTSKEGKVGRTKERRSEGEPMTHERPQQVRLVEHRPYDFFQDQIRWLNRRKVELEERYGKRVTANAMVQLAVDLLIADYELDPEDSQVVRVLVKEERPSVRKDGGPEASTARVEEEAGRG